MKILMTTLNAKFFHKSLALPSLISYCGEFSSCFKLLEFSINQSDDFILNKIYLEKPDIICFSCYIWNIELTKNIISSIKMILPKVKIILGGPEVSYSDCEIFDEIDCDIVVKGEGEAVFKHILDRIINKKEDVRGVFESQVLENLDIIPFCYNDSNVEENKTIYYESSRGCPFSCKYCLSGNEEKIRYLSLERVFSDLSFFLKKKVMQVKFVDRTFNANKKRAFEILNYIIENHNGFTNFHFEISAELLDEKTVQILQKAPENSIQFEIGVQSTNEKTLGEISRKTDLKKLFENVKMLMEKTDIHIHLDLIAGLPHEDLASFERSFNDVYSLKPHMLQLGFLKVLRGSKIRAEKEKFGILHKSNAPYTILSTNDLSFDEILTLKNIEEMVEIYYNSAKCLNTLNYSVSFFESPYHFYKSFSEYYFENGFGDAYNKKMTEFNVLFDFLNINLKEQIETIKDLLTFDMLCADRVLNLPYWAVDKISKDKRDFINSKFSLGKKTHLVFKFDIDVFNFEKTGEILKKDIVVIFEYKNKDAGILKNSQKECVL